MRRNLELLLQLLKPKARIAWSPLDNLHVTTKFIGEYAPDRLDALTTALAAAGKPGELTIRIRGIGWFPNPHNPRVLFAGIQAPDALKGLARDTDAACETLGVPRETKEFHPHLTLARIRTPENLFDLKKAIADLPDTDFGAFTSTQFHLYESKQSAAGSVYTKLASYPLS
jgi:2'-5' RNA ligase